MRLCRSCLDRHAWLWLAHAYGVPIRWAQTYARWIGSDRLPDLHRNATLMQMRTTLNIDDALLRRALRVSGLQEKTAVLHAGLEALIQRESARQLAALGGTERKLKAPPRRRALRTRAVRAKRG